LRSRQTNGFFGYNKEECRGEFTAPSAWKPTLLRRIDLMNITDMTPEEYNAHLKAKFSQRLDEADRKVEAYWQARIAEAVAADREDCLSALDSLYQQMYAESEGDTKNCCLRTVSRCREAIETVKTFRFFVTQWAGPLVAEKLQALLPPTPTLETAQESVNSNMVPVTVIMGTGLIHGEEGE
jgi:hypothetical protein